MDWLGWLAFFLLLFLGGCGRETGHPDVPVGRWDPEDRAERRRSARGL